MDLGSFFGFANLYLGIILTLRVVCDIKVSFWKGIHFKASIKNLFSIFNSLDYPNMAQ